MKGDYVTEAKTDCESPRALPNVPCLRKQGGWSLALIFVVLFLFYAWCIFLPKLPMSISLNWVRAVLDCFELAVKMLFLSHIDLPVSDRVSIPVKMRSVPICLIGCRAAPSSNAHNRGRMQNSKM